MGFTDKVITYNEQEESNLKTILKVAEEEKDLIRKFIKKDLKEIGKFLSSSSKLTQIFAETAAKMALYPYRSEVTKLSHTLGHSPLEIGAMNLLYDISQLEHFGLGCSAGIIDSEEHGPIHVRNLDWGIEGLGELTRVVRMHSKYGPLISVTFPGFIGVLSGMAPKRFSVTLSWAPPPENKPTIRGMRVSPTIAVRHVLENAETYQDAVKMLSEIKLTCSASFVVCGVFKGEGAVVERWEGNSSLTHLGDQPLVQTNHFAGEYTRIGNRSLRSVQQDNYSEEESRKRNCKLYNALKNLPEQLNLVDLKKCLTRSPVCNWETCQQMVFIPSKGVYKVWARK